jgi:DNA-binding XRE family transcriptional regulator
MLNLDELYQQIGNRLKEIRNSQSPAMTQAQLAKIVGLKRTSIANIESGKQKVTLDALYALCHHFQIGIADVLPSVKSVAVQPAKSVEFGAGSYPVGTLAAKAIERHLASSKFSRRN